MQTSKLRKRPIKGALSQKAKRYKDLLRENAQLKKECEKARENGIISTHIARALARGYTDLFYVNMETDELIEFHTDDKIGVLTEARRSADFFEGCKRDARPYVHPDDQELFIKTMNKDYLTKVLDKSKTYEFTYRRIKEGRTFYVRMRITRVEEDKRFIIIAVSDIDELMKRRFEAERIQEEHTIYSRLHALTGNYICVYVVDPKTDNYREFSSTDDYTQSFAQAKEGTNFFNTVREAGCIYNHPDDLNRFLAEFTKEKVMSDIEHSGYYSLAYRFIMDGRPVHVQLKAAMVEEKEGPRLIVGLSDVEAHFRHEEQYKQRIANANTQANIDALTKVKNRHAYQETEARMNRLIAEHRQQPFAVVSFDVNDLKKTNDTLGHTAGDQLLCNACKTICETFKRSPVFRIGGDEFAVISQGRDYKCIDELLKKMESRNAEASRTGGAVVAFGMARFEDDDCVAKVYERADQVMYENKKAMKTAQD